MNENEIDHLIATVKRDFSTRQMTLTDIRREAGFSHVSNSTIWKALRSQGNKPYREELKFILKPENKLKRLAYCNERKNWGIEKWKNYGFTDEMSIEIGGMFGMNVVWRDKTEQWDDDCVGCMKKKGDTLMCWGMIGFSWKGPFYIQIPETAEEKEDAAQIIAQRESTRKADEDRLNEEWKSSAEWDRLRKTELAVYSAQRYAEKYDNAPKQQIPQSHRGKKFKLEKFKRGDGNGVDSWRYVKCVARPLLWPECRKQIGLNPSFELMEDNSPCHDSFYTNEEREKEGISKVDWPPNAPDLNQIEHIWTLMKSRIQTRRGQERVTSLQRMRTVLQE